MHRLPRFKLLLRLLLLLLVLLLLPVLRIKKDGRRKIKRGIINNDKMSASGNPEALVLLKKRVLFLFSLLLVNILQTVNINP